jgi:ABC-type xylose transport system substrate-binding protein
MKTSSVRRGFVAVATMAVAATALVACSSNGSGTGTESSSAPASSAAETSSAPAETSGGSQQADTGPIGEEPAPIQDAYKISFLMPDRGSTRYDQQDDPLFEAQIKKLCPNCTVSYQNAETDAQKQQQQAEAAITNGANLIVLDAVDTTAAANIVPQIQAAGIKVITYDRPVPKAVPDFYVSFDNEAIGKLISDDLVKHLDSTGADKSAGGVLIVNGSPTDDAAMLIKKGIHEGVDPSGYKLLAELDTPDWKPENAQNWVTQQITQFGDQILGVVAANDGTGGGTIAALQAAGMVNPIPPVTGNDAEIAAIQRIIRGDQYNTISKPIKIVATATANAAIVLLSGGTPQATTTLFNTPSQLYIPTVVTKDNVKSVIFDGGIYTYDQVCTADFASACSALNIAK